MSVLLAVITVLSLTSVISFAAEDELVNSTDVSDVAEVNNDTIFEIIARGEGTLLERLAHGGKVALVGMLVVFAVLILLMIIVYIFGAIFGQKKAPAAVKKEVAPSAPVSPVTPATPVSDGEDVIVAVATAAIAAARGESDCAFDVISITKIN